MVRVVAGYTAEAPHQDYTCLLCSSSLISFPGQIGQQMSTWLQPFYSANMSKKNDSVGIAFECRLKHHTGRIWQIMRSARSAV